MKLVELLLALLLMIAGMGGGPAEPAWIECGACGAHVNEWYFVQSDATGAPVAVCDYCYRVYWENEF